MSESPDKIQKADEAAAEEEIRKAEELASKYAEEEKVHHLDSKSKEERVAGSPLDVANDIDFSNKKLAIKAAKEEARIACSGEVDKGLEKSKGLILKRKDGTHYAFKGEYQREENGRMEYLRQDVISLQRSAVGRLVKKIGSSLLNGKKIMNISFPIEIFEPRSELERSAAVLGFAPLFLDKAATCTDPVEQMKLVVTCVVSRMHAMVEQRKPFNPILGETYQGYVDGCPFFYEQICHHPPIYASQLLGRDYIVEGCLEGVGSISINTFYGAFAGLERIIFPKTGNTYYIRYPSGVIEGILYGKRLSYFHNSLRVLDPKTKIYAKVKFNPDRSTWTNMFSKRKYPYDAFIGSIHEVTDAFAQSKLVAIKQNHKAPIKAKDPDFKKTICEITGSVFESLKFGNDEYWHILKCVPYRIVESSCPLPSDATYRGDSLYLLQGELDKAQAAKDEMEEIQRRDRKLRANFDMGISPGLPQQEPASAGTHGHAEKKSGFFSKLFGYN